MKKNNREKETLNAAEKYVKNFDESVKSAREIGFIDSANWQAKRMFTEEQVTEFVEFCVDKIANFLVGKEDLDDQDQEYSIKEFVKQSKKK